MRKQFNIVQIKNKCVMYHIYGFQTETVELRSSASFNGNTNDTHTVECYGILCLHTNTDTVLKVLTYFDCFGHN